MTETKEIPEPGTIERVYYDIDCCIRGHQVVMNHLNSYAGDAHQVEMLEDFCKCEIDSLLDARSSVKKFYRHILEGFYDGRQEPEEEID